MRHYTYYCPSCKKVLEQGSGGRTYLYDSPIKNCPHCGYEYIDSNRIELGLMGRNKYLVTIISRIISGAASSSLFMVFSSIALYYLISALNGTEVVSRIGSLVPCFIWIAYVITIAVKARQEFYTALKESCGRLRNVEYSIMLYKNNYSFPDMDSSLYSKFIGVFLPNISKMRPLINNIANMAYSCLYILIMLIIAAVFWFGIVK